MSLEVFGEGKTEERLMKQIAHLVAPGIKVVPYESGGKHKLVHADPDKNPIKKTLEPLLDPNSDPRCKIRMVILRDWDRGEEIGDIQKSFTMLFSEVLSEQGWIADNVSFSHQLIEYSNVLTLVTHAPDLRVALHIAQPTPIAGLEELTFGNATTDDYILATALLPQVVARFAKDAELEEAALQRKVMQRFRELMGDNGIQNFEAKDFLGAYMAFARFLKAKKTLKYDTFAGIVVARALKYALIESKQIFASIIEAINFVTAEED